MHQGQKLPAVLVVEDDRLIQGMVEESLTEGGFDVTVATSGEEAVKLLKESSPPFLRAGDGHTPRGPARRLGRRPICAGAQPAFSHRLLDG